jgi:hypothetical protein
MNMRNDREAHWTLEAMQNKPSSLFKGKTFHLPGKGWRVARGYRLTDFAADCAFVGCMLVFCACVAGLIDVLLVTNQ